MSGSPLPISTLVVFHDLLGFGSCVANSGGRFDSAMGEVAIRRIINLRRALRDSIPKFPSGTSFFHFNDSVVGILDAQVSYDPSYIAGSARTKMNFFGASELLKFLGASAFLHDEICRAEEKERVGSGGRTFVVLGKRWALPNDGDKNFNEFEELQANIAFSEAYAADEAGSRAGFRHGWLNSMYVNDRIWNLLLSLSFHRDHEKMLTMASSETERLLSWPFRLYWPDMDSLDGTKTHKIFPNNVASHGEKPIELDIFHQKRKFHSFATVYAKRLLEIDAVRDPAGTVRSQADSGDASAQQVLDLFKSMDPTIVS